MLQSTFVKRGLRDIAELGLAQARLKWGIRTPSLWFGFDDPEIGWFLKSVKKKKGPGLEKLRRDFATATGPQTGTPRLYFFPFTKREAKRILAEIGP